MFPYDFCFLEKKTTKTKFLHESFSYPDVINIFSNMLFYTFHILYILQIIFTFRSLKYWSFISSAHSKLRSLQVILLLSHIKVAYFLGIPSGFLCSHDLFLFSWTRIHRFYYYEKVITYLAKTGLTSWNIYWR